jgi:glycerol uptake facilitator-like aquaporin
MRPFTPMSTTSLRRRVSAEFTGTLSLVATVIGSGIVTERLAGANVALALLANTIATGAILVALSFTLGGISGAHFNPAVTVADALSSTAYRGARFQRILRHSALEGLPGQWSHILCSDCRCFHSRVTREVVAQVFSEFVATFGLLAVIWGCSRDRANSVPFAVRAYITAAYWPSRVGEAIFNCFMAPRSAPRPRADLSHSEVFR